MIIPKQKIINEFESVHAECDFVKVGIVSTKLGIRPQDVIDAIAEHKQVAEREEVWRSIVEEAMS